MQDPGRYGLQNRKAKKQAIVILRQAAANLQQIGLWVLKVVILLLNSFPQMKGSALKVRSHCARQREKNFPHGKNLLGTVFCRSHCYFLDVNHRWAKTQPTRTSRPPTLGISIPL